MPLTLDTKLANSSPESATSRRSSLGAVLLLVLFVFWPAVHYQLVYDDLNQLVHNPRLTAWSYVPGYFTTHLWSHRFAAPHYYRPVFLIWFRLLYACLGAPSSTWHIASILAHLVTTACVFILIRSLTGGFKGAALAAMLFAIHPINTEAVAWVSAGDDLLLTMFLVLTVFYYAKRQGPISVPSIIFAALAMFTQETGILAPALIIAYEWTQSRFKNAVINAIPYALSSLFYLAFRVNALRTPIVVSAPSISMGTMVLTWPRLLAVYAFHLVWPVHLSISYDVPVEIRLWPLLLLIAVLAGLLWLVRSGCANIRFGAAWFAITLAPSLAIRYLDWDDFVHDRYLYLPLVGLALIAAVWFNRLQFNHTRVAAAGALVLALCWGTRLNLRIWQDNISLFSQAVRTAPRNPVFKNDLVVSYFKDHRDSEALPLLRQLIEQYPNFPDGYRTMAYYYRQVGNVTEAERYYSIYASISSQPEAP